MVDKPRILVIYTSMSGHTEALARAIADGARGAQNVKVEVKRARDVGVDDFARASAIAFGSPTYYSYMSGELKTLFDNALPYKERFEGKPASPSAPARADSSSASRASRTFCSSSA